MYPYLEVTGTHQQIGEAIGEQFRTEIKRSLAHHFRKIKIKDPQLQQNLAALTRTATRFFPDFIQELQGIARGSGQLFERLLIFSFEEELLPAEKCTTVAFQNKTGVFFGHNEDWNIPLALYIIKAKPVGKPAFIGVANAGQFPGTVAGLNEFGIAYSGNSIATALNPKGLSKTYCLRSFLEATSLAKAIDRVAHHQRTIGNNSILVSGKEKKILSLEWSPTALQAMPENMATCHTNHFLSKRLLPHETRRSNNSPIRYHTARAFLTTQNPQSLNDLATLLSSHAHAPQSICRHGKTHTLASILIDATNLTLSIAAGPPCSHKYTTYPLLP